MIIYKEAKTLTKTLDNIRLAGKKIGFVPTMGALHPGHISLIEAAKKHSDCIVSSIFVNPTQFNDPLDYEKYPITLSNDILLLEKAGCDILFTPSLHEMYPDGFDHLQHFALGALENVLEGEFRPGHFQGVCQVVYKLLKMVAPDQLFTGQKDYQQCLVIRHLLHQFHFSVKMIIEDTCREPSGLAMSSRNLRLTSAQKQQATAIFHMLNHIKSHVSLQPLRLLEEYARNYLLAHGFTKVDYIIIANKNTLEPATTINDETPLIALIAAFIGGVRLIDNMLLSS